LGHNQQEYLTLLPTLLITTFYCPVCGAITHSNQWKTRSSWSSDDAIRGIPQLQVLCTNENCKKTHVIIPDFLNPFKRYVGAEIEAAVQNNTFEDTYAEESTVRRWKKQFNERLPDILNLLIRLLMTEYAIMLSLLECSLGLERLRKILNLFPNRSAATTLGRANVELFCKGRLILYF